MMKKAAIALSVHTIEVAFVLVNLSLLAFGIMGCATSENRFEAMPTHASPSRYPVQVGSRWGFIDRTGKIVIPAQFLEASSFREGLAWIYTDGRSCFIDETGRIVVDMPPGWRPVRHYDEGMVPVQVGKLWGYADRTGRLVVEAVYDFADGFSDGLALVRFHDGPKERRGYIDKTGKLVIEKPSSYGLWGFHDERALVRLEDKLPDNSNFSRCGYIDRTGTFVIKPQFEWADSFSCGLAAVRKNKRWGFVDANGKEVISCVYDEVHSFSEGLATVRIGHEWGVVDTTGRMAIPLQGFCPGRFREGLAPFLAFDDPSQPGSWGKWGYLDRTGRVTIQRQFDFADEFEGDLAAVKIGDTRGYIDRAGQVVWPPEMASTQPSTQGSKPTTAPVLDPKTASLADALQDWITLLEKDDLTTASARWGKDEKAAAEMRELWAGVKDRHRKYDYRKWADKAMAVGDATQFTVGGHNVGYMHVDWEKIDSGWRVGKVWICR